MPDFFSPSNARNLCLGSGAGEIFQRRRRVVEILRGAGITGWRRHLPLPGRPDFTFSKQRVCIFVHGCFWHDCPRCKKRSKTRPGYWAKKIASNRKRDQRVARELKRRGYRVSIVWGMYTSRRKRIPSRRRNAYFYFYTCAACSQSRAFSYCVKILGRPLYGYLSQKG